MTGYLLPWIRISKRIDAQQLTRDEDRAECLRNDPLTHSRISIYLATQLLSQGRWALDHARRVDVPTLIMHGEDDELIDQSACQHAAIRMGSRATLIRWPEMRHDLFQDQGRGVIIEHLVRWLNGLTLFPAAEAG